MADDGRVITAKLDDDLVSRLDTTADRIERSKSWIVRAALEQWLSEEELRQRLTAEALADVGDGRLVHQRDMESWVASLDKHREKTTSSRT